jgi:hypothetical protein
MYVNLPSEKAIRRYWAEKLGELDLETDDACFACGTRTADTLHRAHILARVEGGSDTADNLHMLCQWCHHDSEYLTGDDYWTWFESRTQFDMVISRIITSYGVQPTSLLGKSHDEIGLILLDLAGKIAEKREKREATRSITETKHHEHTQPGTRRGSADG